MGDESGSPKSQGAQKRIPNGHRSGICSSDLRRLEALLLRRVGVHQHRAVAGYPDASLFVCAPSIGLGAVHAHDGLCGYLGSVWQQPAGRNFWPGANNRRCNSVDHGRNGCRWLQRCGNGRTESAWAAAEWLAWTFMPMREAKLLLDSHARFVKYYLRNVAPQWGLGARQCVYLQVTGTVAPASYTGLGVCNANRPPAIPAQSRLTKAPSVPNRTGTLIRFKGSSTKPACSAGECVRQVADTGLKRVLKTVHNW